MKKRGLFVALSALTIGSSPRSLTASVDLLRDFAAAGYTIILTTDALDLDGQRFASGAELLAALRERQPLHWALPIEDVVLVGGSADPTPFWDAARRHNVSLRRSVFITHDGNYEQAARIAGIDRMESGAYVFAAAA